MEKIRLDEEKLNNFVYSYTADINVLEEENKILKDSVGQLKKELDKYKRTPLMLCEVRNIINSKAVIKIPNGSQFLVEISADCKNIQPGDSVLVEQKNLTIVQKTAGLHKFNVEKFVIIEKPSESWNDIGGMDEQIQEIKEVIELPLKKPKLFEHLGIQPPKGVLLSGEPGTGKTLLAKAVARSTNSTFIEIVGSELVQKFIGDGAKLVKDIFELARDKAPSIVFIDELDSIASKRIELGTSGEREVQRTFMQLLAEIDGFKNLDNVKIIGCTNRADILDPAVLRPGRLERIIQIPMPNKEGRKEIFKIHASKMKLARIEVDSLLKKMENFTGADIKAVCTESGYFAIRDNRKIVVHADFEAAIKKIKFRRGSETQEFLRMFG